MNPNFEDPLQESDEHESLELSGIYYSDCGDLESELSLFAQGVGIVEVFEWDDRANEERSTTFDGEWTATDSIVALNLFDIGKIEFEASELKDGITTGVTPELDWKH